MKKKKSIFHSNSIFFTRNLSLLLALGTPQTGKYLPEVNTQWNYSHPGKVLHLYCETVVTIIKPLWNIKSDSTCFHSDGKVTKYINDLFAGSRCTRYYFSPRGLSLLSRYEKFLPVNHFLTVASQWLKEGQPTLIDPFVFFPHVL